MKSLLSIEPRFAETDQMGVIHHATYPIWYEMGRIKYCDDLGMPFKNFIERGIHLAVTELSVNYKKSARFGDDLKLYTYLIGFTKIRSYFKFELYNQNNELINTGLATLAWLDQNMKPLNIQKSHPDIFEVFSKHVVNES
jgi:acyl-CoA thioester hydrolase